MPPTRLEARDYIGLGPAAPASSCSSSSASAGEAGPHLALRLGLPGCESPGRAEDPVDAALTLGPAPAPHRGGAKRGFADSLDRSAARDAAASAASGSVREVEKRAGEAAAGAGTPPAAKAQVVGWPPVRNYRKNTLAANATKTKAETQGKSEAECCYVKVSMDGAPYKRKVTSRITPATPIFRWSLRRCSAASSLAKVVPAKQQQETCLLMALGLMLFRTKSMS